MWTCSSAHVQTVLKTINLSAIGLKYCTVLEQPLVPVLRTYHIQQLSLLEITSGKSKSTFPELLGWLETKRNPLLFTLNMLI